MSGGATIEYKALGKVEKRGHTYKIIKQNNTKTRNKTSSETRKIHTATVFVCLRMATAWWLLYARPSKRRKTHKSWKGRSRRCRSTQRCLSFRSSLQTMGPDTTPSTRKRGSCRESHAPAATTEDNTAAEGRIADGKDEK